MSKVDNVLHLWANSVQDNPDMSVQIITMDEAKQQLLAEVLDMIGENELNQHPEVVGSPTAAKLWTRDVFREELRAAAKERFK